MRPSSPRSSPEQGYCHGQNQRPNSTTAVPARRIRFMLSALSVTLDGQSLGPADVVAVARHGDRVSLGAQAKTRLERARALVDRLVAEDRVVYGLTTGVGALKNVRIPPADTRQLQRNLFMSHAVGVGPPLPEELLRAGSLQPVELRAKDALSVLNGTHFMTGAASLVLHDAKRLLLTADVVAALSVEALRGSRTAFDPRIHAARPHPGQVASAT